ncbi:MAG: hypothetical protein K2K72_01960, partial [Duncaniella sp.]|nr:hypothetical protein [Duncaniella sp.]
MSRGRALYLPQSMLDDPKYSVGLTDLDFDLLRFRHDFEFWAAKCVRITDKTTKRLIPFTLNAPQRRLLQELESQRLASMPIRIIMLKARQWGGSTLVQIYFAWIQIIHLSDWHSLICAHVKDSASNIRGMFTRLLASYPDQYRPEGMGKDLRPYEGMENTRVMAGRGCRLTVCSSENQEATRGQDYSMAHLSEVAFWKDSRQRKPADLIRSVVAGIDRAPMTAVVMESTANGAGNFFHSEWLRAVEGNSDKLPFFVPWYEIERYREPVDDEQEFIASLDDYERWLLEDRRCPPQAVKWYRNKRREYPDHRSMMAEYPTTAAEAFTATDRGVFAPEGVERLRREGCSLQPRLGEIDSCRGVTRFIESSAGRLKMWTPPRRGHSYTAALDIGGRSSLADYSVLSVLDTSAGLRPEVVAQWRGHIDHDLLARIALDVATHYNRALLVVESNTWEQGSEGHGQYILGSIDSAYPRLYRRPPADSRPGWLPGFHTNVKTKTLVISHLISLVRDGGYIERDPEALAELSCYELKADGSYGAREGKHDDILMSRAIALWVAASEERHSAGSRLS